MSLLVFPELPGIDIAQSKRPEVKSQVFINPLSGRESRLRFQVYPKYTFKLSVNALIEDAEDNDLSALLGFMVKVAGQSLAFLYRDPTDYHVDGQMLGTGDGSQTDYPLRRNFGGFIEPVNNPNLNWVDLFIDGILDDPVNHAVLDGGIIHFDVPPANGAVITWTGDYYYRVRLLADGYDFVRVASNFYECMDIEFIGSVRDMV